MHKTIKIEKKIRIAISYAITNNHCLIAVISQSSANYRFYWLSVGIKMIQKIILATLS